jgi:hypothetical protein
MAVDDSAPVPTPPDRKLALNRFAMRAVRVSASTIAVVALFRRRLLPPLNAEPLQKREPGVCRKASSSALETRPRSVLR